MIKPEQLTKYDAASREIAKAADILDAINVAGLNREDIAKLYALIKNARELRHELFSAAHAVFVRARMGEG